jgi:polar amino acid transport system permease protein
MTILLYLKVIPLGLGGGLRVALLSTVKNRFVRWCVVIYTDFFRAFAPLVLLIFIYYGVPFIGIDLPAFIAVTLGFFLNTSSYYGEISRAGIETIPRGQSVAARSTGLNRLETMAFIIVPQATRNVVPDLISNTLEVVKLTSAGLSISVSPYTEKSLSNPF